MSIHYLAHQLPVGAELAKLPFLKRYQVIDALNLVASSTSRNLNLISHTSAHSIPSPSRLAVVWPVIRDGIKFLILKSSLAPGKKLDAMKSFFYPSLQYAQRTQQRRKLVWVEFDECIRKIIKKEILSVPENTSNEYLYGSSADTLLGIPLSAEDSDIAHIDGAFKLLTSDDDFVKNLAWKDLFSTVQHRLNTGYKNSSTPPPKCTLDHLASFLSGKKFPGMNPNSSIFTKARMASDHLGVYWFIDKDFSVSTPRRGVTISNRLKVFKKVRENLRSALTYALKCKSNQGKTLHCFTKSKVSAHYNRTGDFIRFCDWRWVHKTRLNLLPVNGIKKDVPL